ncbi:MAG: hypothetical protein M1816_005847 [Peltula sp. TS41687]|nr:MAG: hypothetical protein M1816_005847 [Peltula sp. TS41687]
MTDDDDDDLFAPLFNFEERFYAEGYEQGLTDGTLQGRSEGLVFGIEKGFERFLELARLHGRAMVWSSRMRKSQDHSNDNNDRGARDVAGGGTSPSPKATRNEETTTTTRSFASSSPSLLAINHNPRLQKHIATLMTLTDPATLSYENSEEAVSAFEERLRRAKAKVKIIERLVGENATAAAAAVVVEGGSGVAAEANTNSMARRKEDGRASGGGHAMDAPLGDDDDGEEGNIEDPAQLARTLGGRGF